MLETCFFFMLKLSFNRARLLARYTPSGQPILVLCGLRKGRHDSTPLPSIKSAGAAHQPWFESNINV